MDDIPTYPIWSLRHTNGGTPPDPFMVMVTAQFELPGPLSFIVGRILTFYPDGSYRLSSTRPFNMTTDYERFLSGP